MLVENVKLRFILTFKSNKKMKNNNRTTFFSLIDKEVYILKRGTKSATQGIQDIYTHYQKALIKQPQLVLFYFPLEG